MNWKALIAGFLLGGCIAAAEQQWRLGAQISQGQTDLANAKTHHEAGLQTVSDAAASAASAALAVIARSASEVAAVERTYRTEQHNAQKTIDALRADVRAGDVRLRVATASCLASTGGDGVPGTGAGTDGAGTAELDGSTADALLGITGDGDRIARKVSAVQEYAREAQRMCGAP